MGTEFLTGNIGELESLVGLEFDNEIISKNGERTCEEIRIIEEAINERKEKRKFCAERGYHCVNKEEEGDMDVMDCYYCKTGFSREIARETGVVYRVEPQLV